MSAARPHETAAQSPIAKTNTVVSRLSLFAADNRIVDAVAIPNTRTILALEVTSSNTTAFVRHELDEKDDRTIAHQTTRQPHDHIDLFSHLNLAVTYSRERMRTLDICAWDMATMTPLNTSNHYTPYFHPTIVNFTYRVIVNPIMGGRSGYVLAFTKLSDPFDIMYDANYLPLYQNPNCIAAIPGTNEFLVGDSNGCTRFSITEAGPVIKVDAFAERKDDPISAVGITAASFAAVVGRANPSTTTLQVGASAAAAAGHAVVANASPLATDAHSPYSTAVVHDGSVTTQADVKSTPSTGQIVITGSQKGILQTWQRTLSATGSPIMRSVGELLPQPDAAARIGYFMPMSGYSFVVMIAGKRAHWVDLSIVEKPEVVHHVVLTGDYEHEKRMCSYTSDAKLVTPQGELIDAVSFPDALLQTAASEFDQRSAAGPDVTALMLRYFGMFPEAKINAFTLATVEVVAETSTGTPAAKKQK